MNRRLFFTFLLLFSFSLFLIPSSGLGEVGMVTGSKTGTYIKIGSDIAKIAKENGLDILVKESEGSLDNIERMLSSENAAIGIVQSDVLGYLYSAMPNVAKQLRLIYPLYNEEVHVFARKEIQTFKDLQGKRVAVGTKGSGNWLTMTNMLHMMGVEPAERITDIGPLDAVSAVLSGDLDAMIYVAGKPVSLFVKLNKLKEDPDPTFKEILDSVHFIPLNDPMFLEQYYVASEIGSNDYEWYDGTVPTIAVKAVLVSFDFSGKKSGYYKMRCDQLSQFGSIIRDNFQKLQEEGHTKWKEVDLDQKIGKWELDKCSHKPGPKPTPSFVQPSDKKHKLWKTLREKIME